MKAGTALEIMYPVCSNKAGFHNDNNVFDSLLEDVVVFHLGTRL